MVSDGGVWCVYKLRLISTVGKDDSGLPFEIALLRRKSLKFPQWSYVYRDLRICKDHSFSFLSGSLRDSSRAITAKVISM